ncbi:MAG: sugar ABC transporter permease [bacterium]|nr:sugar ABC transporter permease [bacterium]
MTVVNYSVQDIVSPDQRVFVGWEWFKSVLRDPELHAAFGRQVLFSVVVLAIELPLGLSVALCLPRGPGGSTWQASLCTVLIAMPLLVPWNVVGTIWQVFARTDIGLGGAVLTKLGVDYNYALDPVHAWGTVVVMDVWHWTPLVVLLCYAGLRAIPETYYGAAAVDGASRWAVFRYIELPRLSGVLTIGVLLRFMDSFVIYTEPFVLTGGGPGSSTTFLSQHLSTLAVGQFDLGRASAFSLIYFLPILIVCYVFYTLMTREERS